VVIRSLGLILTRELILGGYSFPVRIASLWNSYCYMQQLHAVVSDNQQRFSTSINNIDLSYALFGEVRIIIVRMCLVVCLLFIPKVLYTSLFIKKNYSNQTNKKEQKTRQGTQYRKYSDIHAYIT